MLSFSFLSGQYFDAYNSEDVTFESFFYLEHVYSNCLESNLGFCKSIFTDLKMNRRSLK